MNRKELLSILRKEMAPALGVTEPSTIALASAIAYQSLPGELEKIELLLDPGIFKNAYSCAIAGTEEKGIEIAALLGTLAGIPEAKLEVLKGIKKEDINKAIILKEKGIVDVKIKKNCREVFVGSKIYTDNGSARAIIKNSHANVVFKELNGKVEYDRENEKNESKSYDLPEFNLNEILDFLKEATFEEVKFTLEAVEMNRELARQGEKGAGMKLGPGLKQLVKEGILKDDLLNYAQILTAHAVDARMGGLAKPAMSFCGSGDHGIIATLPLAAIAEKKDIPDERLAKAIVLSYIITFYLKNYTGKLSAYCGCAVAAGTGVSAGITYMLGGDDKQITGAVNNMAGNITGMICDGGNFGCSLKAATAAEAAIKASLLALNDYYLENNNGIVGNNIKETLLNMGQIATPGMEETNNVILDILQK